MTTAPTIQHDTFTDRDVEVKVIESIDGRTVSFADGWCFGGVPEDVLPTLHVGVEYLQETRGFALVTGMATCYRTRRGEPVVGEWLWHKTDSDLDREHAEMVAGFKAHREAELAAHREDWTRREAALPSPLRRRLERFRANGGDEFDTDGWGYELTICELAVLYAGAGGMETAEVGAYAAENGTSGNQHDFARLLARELAKDDMESEDVVANAPSALTPLTGNVDYSGADADGASR